MLSIYIFKNNSIYFVIKIMLTHLSRNKYFITSTSIQNYILRIVYHKLKKNQID